MLHLSSRNCAKRNIRDPGTADARAQLVTLGTGSSLCSGRHDNMSCIALVMPGLVPGIHPSTHARANGEMDPRDKPEDDILEQPSPQTSSPRRAGGAHREGGDSGHFANEGAVEVSPRGASPPTRTPAARCTRFPPSCRRRVYDTTGMTPVERIPNHQRHRAPRRSPSPRLRGEGRGEGRPHTHLSWSGLSRPSIHQRAPERAERWILGTSPRMTSVARTPIVIPAQFSCKGDRITWCATR
jgi:hypothetical protein